MCGGPSGGPATAAPTTAEVHSADEEENSGDEDEADHAHGNDDDEEDEVRKISLLL